MSKNAHSGPPPRLPPPRIMFPWVTLYIGDPRESDPRLRQPREWRAVSVFAHLPLPPRPQATQQKNPERSSTGFSCLVENDQVVVGKQRDLLSRACLSSILRHSSFPHHHLSVLPPSGKTQGRKDRPSAGFSCWVGNDHGGGGGNEERL